MVKLAESDDDVLSIVPLKQADDFELSEVMIDEWTILEKILYFKDNGYDLFLATNNNQPIGYAVGKGRVGGLYISHGVYVDKFFRRNGVGTLLIQEQIQRAKKMGCMGIYGKTWETNISARRIHEKNGFTQRNPTDYLFDLNL